jgi:hypothetical protein
MGSIEPVKVDHVNKVLLTLERKDPYMVGTYYNNYCAGNCANQWRRQALLLFRDCCNAFTQGDDTLAHFKWAISICYEA